MSTEDDAMVWTQVLDDFEANVAKAEAFLAASTVTLDAQVEQWSPPAAAGPLPAELHERARGLLERQRRVAANLPAVIAGMRGEGRYAQRILAATSHDQAPVYIDRTA